MGSPQSGGLGVHPAAHHRGIHWGSTTLLVPVPTIGNPLGMVLGTAPDEEMCRSHRAGH